MGANTRNAGGDRSRRRKEEREREAAVQIAMCDHAISSEGDADYLRKKPFPMGVCGALGIINLAALEP